MMPAASLIPERILHLTWVLVGLKIYSVVDGQVLVTLGCQNTRGKGVRETMTRCHPHQPEEFPFKDLLLYQTRIPGLCAGKNFRTSHS